MPPSETRKPWVIAHRGASGLRPEHTLEAYRLGIAQGADFAEPDLVLTSDGALLIRHDNELSLTTDIAERPEFAERRTTRTVDGKTIDGWFSEDFSLAALMTLRARERMPDLRPDSAAHNGRGSLMTFDALLALVAEETAARGRPIGIVAELKHPVHFAGAGLRFEDALVPALAGFGRDDPMFVASFDAEALRGLRPLTQVRLIQLLVQSAAPDLRAIAEYADAIGPAKAMIVPRRANGAGFPSTPLVADAHAAGLLVFAWTFRSENLFLPAELRRGDDPAAHGDAAAEYRTFYDLGVDAVFSDFPADAVAARA